MSDLTGSSKNWWQRWSAIRKPTAPRPRSSRPMVEALEERALLTANASGVLDSRAFVDANQNGIFDAGEKSIAGAPIRLTGTTASGTPVALETATSNLGTFQFANLQPGTYSYSSPGITGYEGGELQSEIVIRGGETINRNLIFRGLLLEEISLRQFLTSTSNDDFPQTEKPSETGTEAVSERENNRPTVKDAISPLTLKTTDAVRNIDLASVFDDIDMKNSTVRFETSEGNINVQLFDRAAPQTVANFYNYVTKNAYDNTIFHRLVDNFVIQGGGYKLKTSPAPTTLTEVPADAPVKNEFDGQTRSNTRGRISMAKVGGDPNSATNEFFFNLANNSSNLDNQNGGFTAFGEIKTNDTASFRTLTDLSNLSTQNKSSVNIAFSTIPLKGSIPTGFPTGTTESNYALVRDVVVVDRPEVLTYQIVSNSNSAVVGATLVDNRLTLDPSTTTGSSTIVVKATDKFGASVTTSFTVTVRTP